MFAVKKSKCTDCNLCIDVCPCDAIESVNGKCEIDPDLCVECGACYDVCEFDAIFEAPLAEIPFILAEDEKKL